MDGVYYRAQPHEGAAAAKSLQSCPTLCDPRDGSPPGSSVPGSLQERILEWVAISFSKALLNVTFFPINSRVIFPLPFEVK